MEFARASRSGRTQLQLVFAWTAPTRRIQDVTSTGRSECGESILAMMLPFCTWALGSQRLSRGAMRPTLAGGLRLRRLGGSRG
eukprot:4436681-Pyramimonas_sp.AAC.1